MDNRDEIIQTQMDLISTLVNNNLRNVYDDFFGTPNPKAPAPPTPGKPVVPPKTPGPTGNEQVPAAEPKPAEAQQAEEETAE